MKKMIVLSFIAGAIAATGCHMQEKKAQNSDPIDPANLDTTVAPGADFYEYACGGWIKNNPLKPEYSRFGIFDQMRDLNQQQLRTLVEKLAGVPQEELSIPWKISKLYKMGMDSVKLNADGIVPVKGQLDQIHAIATKDDVSRIVAQMHKEGMTPFFALYVGADEKNSSMNIVQLYQAGLAMSDRDYYLVNDETSAKIRQQYTAYIQKLFELAGYAPLQIQAATDAVMKIETAIARASYTREELRDSQRNYNKVPLAKFKASTDPLNWDIYFGTLGLNDVKEIDAKQAIFYEGLDTFMKDVSIEEQKYYLAYNLLDRAAPYLSDDFSNVSFDFYGKVMSGKQEQQPRWKRALSSVNGALSEAVGQMYVAEYFPPEARQKMEALVGNLQKALGERINGLEWMSEATKAKAQEKLAAILVKIGYPDKWRDYEGLMIKDDSYWDNIRRAAAFDTEYMLAEAGKPVDKQRWLMSPQTINAYYNPTTNEICFPAAILQPPFFNMQADDAVNYGAIGVVIGHEMTHGFDDQGRQYDKNGNLQDWWTAEDAQRFTERADKLVKQYDDIVVLDTVHANGRFTLGENIADQGGLLVSYEAYQQSQEGQDKPAAIGGFSPEQRFYLAYAALWAQNIRNEEILRLTKIDPHSLGKWRVNAALKNIDTFYDAFDITVKDSMYRAPEDRVVIW